MPELMEQMYCSQQIVIPPKYPYIIKRFAKAAIKTQPYDLLRWSCEYFQALASGRAPPVKLRLEYPVFSSRGGLTTGYLRMLYQQLKGDVELRRSALERSWRGACLDTLELVRILCLCDAYRDGVQTVETLVFFAVAGGLLTKSLTQTMILLCETMTEEPEGGNAAVPVDDFVLMYEYLARLDASTDVNYVNGVREGQQDETEPQRIEEEEQAPDVASVNSISDTEEKSDKLREMSKAMITDQSNTGMDDSKQAEEKKPDKRQDVKIIVTDEDGVELIPAIDGEETESVLDCNFGEDQESALEDDEEAAKNEDMFEKNHVQQLLEEHRQSRLRRIEDLEVTFNELALIVQRWKYVNYDLGMIAGRQMSTGSGEFVVHTIERDIMAIIDEQIEILPDPDLKKKKARPEEVEMIRGLLEEHVEENMELIVPEQEAEEEEEVEPQEVVVVYAVPGIGPTVPEAMVAAVVAHARSVAAATHGLFMPRHIRHFLCPPLEIYDDPLDKPQEKVSDPVITQ